MSLVREIGNLIAVFIIFVGVIIIYATLGVALILTGKWNRNIYKMPKERNL